MGNGTRSACERRQSIQTLGEHAQPAIAHIRFVDATRPKLHAFSSTSAGSPRLSVHFFGAVFRRLRPFLPIAIWWKIKSLQRVGRAAVFPLQDRKSTRLNSSHANISYAVFCLKKKKTTV